MFGAACFCVGQAVQLANGALHPTAIGWLTAAILLTLCGVLAPAWSWLETRAEPALVAGVAGAVSWQLYQLLSVPVGTYLRPTGPEPFAHYFLGLAVVAVLAGAGLARRPFGGPLQAVGLVAAFVFVGRWLLAISPNPWIDVFYFQRDGANELLAGGNPYAMTYPDIYGNSPFYGPGLSVGGRLQFGFPYPPLSLFFALAGLKLGGDYRWAQLATMAAAGLCIAFLRPGRRGPALAALFLLTPRGLFVLEQGWTEPYIVFGLAATVLSAARFPAALPWVLGLFLVLKQYLCFAVPAAFLLLPRPWPPRADLVRFALKLIAVGALVTLPLVLWNVKAFWHDVVALQVYQPFRPDSLSYLAWWVTQGKPQPPTSLAFIAALVTLALGLWRAPRTPAGFAGTISLVFLSFFAFNKQAFCNYYYFVIGALAVAAAAVPPRTDVADSLAAQ